MSINFPLILVLASAATGLIWLLDIVLLRPRRVRAAELAKENPGSDIDDAALLKIMREPVYVEYAVSFFPVLLIVLVLRSFVAEPFQIPSGSMIPTLQVGDFIVVNKFAYGLRLPVTGTKVFSVDEPKNGEVMVFIPPHEDEYFIKRVIGIPGDRVRYENKTIYINDVAQPQKFLARIPPENPRVLLFEENLGGIDHMIQTNPASDRRVQEWVIPEGKYFMMGDNRDQSSDSRYWGFASEDAIVGKAFAIWMHWEPGFNLPAFSRNGWIE